jgi:hypothetical protein
MRHGFTSPTTLSFFNTVEPDDMYGRAGTRHSRDWSQRYQIGSVGMADLVDRPAGSRVRRAGPSSQHLGHVMSKLHLSDRVELAVYRQGLVD